MLESRYESLRPSPMECEPTPYVKVLKDGRAVTSEFLDNQRTAQDDDSPWQNVPEPGAAVAADVDDAQTVNLEGKEAPD